MELGERIRRVRRTRGLTLREVARRAGLTTGLLSMIENHLRTPSLGTLRQVALALDTPVELLVGEDDAPLREFLVQLVRALP